MDDIPVLSGFIEALERLGRVIVDSLKLIEEQNRLRLAKPQFYNRALQDGINFTLDDRERTRIFVWSPVNFVMVIASPVAVNLSIAAGEWTLLGFVSGTAFSTSGLATAETITFKCTNDLQV